MPCSTALKKHAAVMTLVVLAAVKACCEPEVTASPVLRLMKETEIDVPVYLLITELKMSAALAFTIAGWAFLLGFFARLAREAFSDAA